MPDDGGSVVVVHVVERCADANTAISRCLSRENHVFCIHHSFIHLGLAGKQDYSNILGEIAATLPIHTASHRRHRAANHREHTSTHFSKVIEVKPGIGTPQRP